MSTDFSIMMTLQASTPTYKLVDPLHSSWSSNPRCCFTLMQLPRIRTVHSFPADRSYVLASRKQASSPPL